MGIIDKAVDWAQKIADNNSHGYDQNQRWGPDYDCSSFVIEAYEQAGVPVKTKGATYTGNMRQVFLQCGFTDVTGECNLATGSGMKKGDILLNTIHHTVIVKDTNTRRVISASSNEKGTATGGKTGDQTGKEIFERAYYNYPWDYVLRYKEKKQWLETGDQGEEVLQMQKNLIYIGFSCGVSGADGVFGKDTEKAVKEAQKTFGLSVDGQYGTMTKEKTEAAVKEKKDKEPKKAELSQITLPYVQKGTKGVGASVLQCILGTEINGTFGTEDVEALKVFQKNTRQSQDGVCGENSWRAVCEHLLANTK